MMQKLNTFHDTRLGHLVFGVIELAMCYGFVNWALDSGSVWWWGVAFVLLIGTLQNFVRAAWPRKSKISREAKK